MLVLLLVAAGRYSSKSGAEILDWKPKQSYEEQIELEMTDVDEMLKARNERRRRRGRAEVSEEDFRAEVEANERAQRERAERYRRERESSAQGGSSGSHRSP